MRGLRKHDGGASRRREADKPAALLIRLEREPQVSIVAADWFQKQDAKPLAELVEHVLRAAMRRPTGTA